MFHRVQRLENFARKLHIERARAWKKVTIETMRVEIQFHEMNDMLARSSLAHPNDSMPIFSSTIRQKNDNTSHGLIVHLSVGLSGILASLLSRIFCFGWFFLGNRTSKKEVGI